MPEQQTQPPTGDHEPDVGDWLVRAILIAEIARTTTDGSEERTAAIAGLADALGIDSALAKKLVRGADSELHPTRRGEISQRETHYRDAVNGDILSNFVLSPKAVIKEGSTELLLCDAKTEDGGAFTDIQISPDSLDSKRGLRKDLNSLRLTWTGTDENTIELKGLLAAEQVPVVHGVPTVGRHEHEGQAYWVSVDQVLGTGGVVGSPALILTGHARNLTTALDFTPSPSEVTLQVAQLALPRLHLLHEQKAMWAIIGWFFAAAVAPVIRQRLGGLPHLSVIGTAGCGKTSLLRDIMLPLSGYRQGTSPMSVKMTPYALLRTMGTSNACPVVLDEYRPADMLPKEVNLITRVLRQLYGGETERRGRSDLSLDEFELSVPVCLAGEARPESTAILERAISVELSKSWLTANAAGRELFNELRAAPLGRLAPAYAQFTLGADVEGAIETAQGVVAHVLDGAHKNPPERLRRTLAAMVTGLVLLEEFGDSLGVEVPATDGFGPAILAVLDSATGGHDDPRSGLDEFLDTLSAMAANGRLTEDTHYASVAGKLCIDLPACYELYREHVQRTGQQDCTNGLKTLRRLAKESQEAGGYVTKVGKRVSLGERKPRCIEIDSTRVAATLPDFGLPVSSTRQHGGLRVSKGGTVVDLYGPKAGTPVTPKAADEVTVPKEQK